MLPFDKVRELRLASRSVGMEGIGPSTSVLSGQRSATELHAQDCFYIFYILAENIHNVNNKKKRPHESAWPLNDMDLPQMANMRKL